jgi:ubiquinone/menaquinone biosynthesis C-methylase UbiE
MFGLLMLRYVELRRDMRVLDVGCGTGFPLLELAQRLGPTCHVVGLDPWEPAVERARLKAEIRGVKNVEVHIGDAAKMPFGERAFDLVVSNLGVNNFENPGAALAECRRVLEPSGRLVLTTNLRGHMQEFYAVFETTLRELAKEDALGALRRHVAHRVTLDGIRTLFERAGFTVSRVVEESTAMRFLDGSALFRHYFIKLGFLEGWRGVVHPADRPEVFARLETNLNRLAQKRGDLTLTIPMAYVEGEPLSAP